MGGNAVLGYNQSFDMEGDSGIVARTYGTCVLITKKPSILSSSSYYHPCRRQNQDTDAIMTNRIFDEASYANSGSKSSKKSLIRKRSDTHLSDGSDVNDVGSVDDDDVSSVNRTRRRLGVTGKIKNAVAAAARYHEAEKDEIQILTLTDFGPHVRVRIGGLVVARSVKYLGKLASKLSDQETRDGWWSELRDEIRSHAKTLCCSHVIGYSEASTIHDDVCVLSITATAASVRGLPDLTRDHKILMKIEKQLTESNTLRGRRVPPSLTGDSTPGFPGTPYVQVESDDGIHDDVIEEDITNQMVSSEFIPGQLLGDTGLLDRKPITRKLIKEQRYKQRLERRCRRVLRVKKNSSELEQRNESKAGSNSIIRARPARPCSYCHVPYHHRLAPFSNMKLVPCLLCGKKWVPEILLSRYVTVKELLCS